MLKLYKLTVFVCVFAFATLTNAQDYETIIKGHLEANKSTLGVTDQDISGLTINDEIFSRKSTTTHVYAIQKINNIEVFNGGVNVAFKDGVIIHVASNLQKDIASRVNGVSPVLTPTQAAFQAATSLGLGNSNFSLTETISPNQFVLNQGGVSIDEVPVKLVYQPTEDNTLKLAWDLSIHTLDSKHWYSVRVDAFTGELLEQFDWILRCTYENHGHENISRTSNVENTTGFGFNKAEVANELLAGEQYKVYALPVESPNHGNGFRSLITEPQSDASPFGWHDINGADGAEFTITRGNNAWAFEDLDGQSDIGDSPDGGAELIFDFPIDLTLDGPAYTNAAVTNLFYWNNVIHDIFYEYGFDEESGNFQDNNYENGGIGEDYVFALSQDGSGLDNATFGTPPDGNNPVMRMFLWNRTGETGNLEVTAPADLAGDYGLTISTFSSLFPSLELPPLMGELVLVEDTDASGDPLDACDAVANAGDIDGKIAVIRRGSCTFVIKVEAAEAAGAIGVIIVNNVADDPINLGIGQDDETDATIPAGMISQADGDPLIAALQNGETITVNASRPRLIDGSFDNGIITHEYGHGISNRLTGGRLNTNCLNNAEQMGEGWSDYFGMMLTMRSGDTAEQGRGVGTFAINQPTTGNGIRPRPYSTDFAVNELTYATRATYSNNEPPHRTGHLWATMIWDMTWAFIDEYGFNSDLYNGERGNNIALQLVMDGLKLQPCNPGFVDGRDAILAAVEINTLIPEEDKDKARCTIWNVFANRGLGLSADQGNPDDRTDGTEAFDVPTNGDGSACLSLSVDEASIDSVFSIYPNPSNGEITVSVAGAFGEGQIRIYDINGREVYNKAATLEGNVSVSATGLSRGVYIMNIITDSSSVTSKLIIE